MPSVDVSEVVNTSTNGDHDRFAHYVEKTEITRALVEGVPVVALCGKIWVPSRAPERFQVCKTCKDIHDRLSEVGNGQV